MARTKRGVTTRARHKKILKMAKGFRGRNSTCYRIALQKVEKAMQYAYRDRKAKKTTFRSLWIVRINAGVRPHGLTYSKFMYALEKANIKMDRKVLAGLAMKEPASFNKIVEQAKAALA